MPNAADRRGRASCIGDAVVAARERIRAGRTALPSHALETGDLRRWAIAACTAELKHAEVDTLDLVVRHALAAVIDRRADSSWHAEFRLPHEHAAALVLNWASHLKTQEGLIVGPWSRWHLTTAPDGGRCLRCGDASSAASSRRSPAIVRRGPRSMRARRLDAPAFVRRGRSCRREETRTPASGREFPQPGARQTFPERRSRGSRRQVHVRNRGRWMVH